MRALVLPRQHRPDSAPSPAAAPSQHSLRVRALATSAGAALCVTHRPMPSTGAVALLAAAAVQLGATRRFQRAVRDEPPAPAGLSEVLGAACPPLSLSKHFRKPRLQSVLKPQAREESDLPWAIPVIAVPAQELQLLAPAEGSKELL